MDENCFHGCDLGVVLSGHDELLKLCGPCDVPAPFGYCTFEQCADPSAIAEMAREALEPTDTDLDSLVPGLAEKFEVNEGNFDVALLKDALSGDLKRRAHNHGNNLPGSPLCEHLNETQKTKCIFGLRKILFSTSK